MAHAGGLPSRVTAEPVRRTHREGVRSLREGLHRRVAQLARAHVSRVERIEREALFRRKSIDSVSLRTDQDYFPLLRSFFIRRAKRLRRQ